MKLFKDAEDNIFAYEEDGTQDHLIDNKTAITQEEADVIIEAQAKIYHQKWLDSLPSKEEQIAKLQSQIDALKA